MWPASGDSIYIYTRSALENFRSLARNETTPSGCQIFPPSAAVVPDRRRPSDHPAVLQECPTDLHKRSTVVREGPPLLPVDRRRLPLGRRPFSRRPPPHYRLRAPRRPTTSSPSATAPLPYHDDVLPLRAASPTVGQEPPPIAPPPPTAPPPPPPTAPVDDIVEDTPCKLVIPYERKLDKF
jgi:hypothetical protein